MPEYESLSAQATELLVERVTARFEVGDNLSEALATTTIPQTFVEDQYDRDTQYEFETMVKLVLFGLVRQHSHNYLEFHLNRWPHLRDRFNLETVPRQQTFSHTWTARFSAQGRHTIKCAAHAIAAEGVEYGALKPELAPDDPDDEELDDDGVPKREYIRTRTQQSVRFARKNVIPHFETHRASNKTYSDTAIFDVLARMCATRGSAHSEGEYGWITDDGYTPDHTTLLRAMKKIGGEETKQLTLDEVFTVRELTDIPRIRDAIIDPFNESVDNIISSIDGDTPFNDRFNIAAIDTTFMPISISPWEDREKGIPNPDFPAMASGYKKKHESNPQYPRGFKFATITLVGQNVPIILGVEPVRNNSKWQTDDAPSDSHADIVSRLLDRAEQFVDLDLVLFDRGFFSHSVLGEVDARGVTYLAPKPEYEPDTSTIEDIDEHPTADAAVGRGKSIVYQGREHDIQQLYVPSSEKTGSYAVFVTNMDRIEPEHIHHVVGIYNRRWDIENQFKSIKDFMPRTSSMDFRVRFLIFVFGALMYNLWRLTDYLVKRSIGVDIRDDPIVTARTFVRAVGMFLRDIG